MRSGSNWTFLRGQLDRVTTRTLANGQQVSEVHVELPLGRPCETSVMVLPAVTWNPDLAARLAALPRGVTLQLAGHLSARRFVAAGVERVWSEVLIDTVAVDIGDVWRATESAAALPEPEPLA